MSESVKAEEFTLDEFIKEWGRILELAKKAMSETRPPPKSPGVFKLNIICAGVFQCLMAETRQRQAEVRDLRNRLNQQNSRIQELEDGQKNASGIIYRGILDDDGRSAL